KQWLTPSTVNSAKRPVPSRKPMKMRPTLARKSSIGAAAIDAMMPATERSQDLIGDGAGVAREVVDPIFVVEQIGVGAGPGPFRVDAGDIDRDQIHRDTPHHRRALAGDADAGFVAGRAQEAVGVARRQGRDSSSSGHAMAAVIAHRLAFFQFAYLKNFCFKCN